MAETLQIKRPDSLSKIAEDHIRKGIVRGNFQLGETLQESKLSTAMGISKTPIREALAALKLQTAGITIDNLTPEQTAYGSDFSAGT